MSSVAASLVVQALLQGIVVENVSIDRFDIVATVVDIDESKLVKLQIDFKNGSVKFLKSLASYDTA